MLPPLTQPVGTRLGRAPATPPPQSHWEAAGPTSTEQTLNLSVKHSEVLHTQPCSTSSPNSPALAHVSACLMASKPTWALPHGLSPLPQPTLLCRAAAAAWHHSLSQLIRHLRLPLPTAAEAQSRVAVPAPPLHTTAYHRPGLPHSRRVT